MPVTIRPGQGAAGARKITDMFKVWSEFFSHLGLPELQSLVKIAQRRVARANMLLEFS
jgi:hypothetical protein